MKNNVNNDIEKERMKCTIKRKLFLLILCMGVCMWLFGCDKNKVENTSGKAGENITWTYDKRSNTLTFTGSGPMDLPEHYFKDYKIKKVVFDDNITSLCDSLLSWHTELEGEIKLPTKLEKINSFSFYHCSGLTGNLVIPEGVTVISDYAFSGCEGLNGTLSLPKGLLSIGEETFHGCSSLTGSLVLPEGLTEIGLACFSGCSGFTGDLILPDGIKSLGRYTFSECEGLDGTLHLPNDLETIDINCFFQCKNFKGDLILPDGVTDIGNYAFEFCGFDGKLVLPTNLENLGESSFAYNENLTGELLIPDTIRIIPYGCFQKCKSITSVKLPGNLKVIGKYAFQCDEGLKNFSFPDSVEVIGDRAFEMCKQLEGELILPKSLTSLGVSSFEACEKISKIHFPEELLCIKNSAFKDCKELAGAIVIPDKVTSLGEDAFYNCENITRVDFGESIVSIGKDAFKNCTSLKTATFKACIPDYYELDEKGSSFMEACQLDFPKGAEKAKKLWDESVKKAEADAKNTNSSTNLNGSDTKDEPYYWIYNLEDDFYGLGVYSDICIRFQDQVLSVFINDREFSSSPYQADKNSDEQIIESEGAYIRTGKIKNLRLDHDLGPGNYIVGELELFDGTKEEIVFSNDSEDCYYIALDRIAKETAEE